MSFYCLTNIYIGSKHVHHDGSTSAIDLVFTSNPSSVSNSEIIPPLANSDHYGVLLELKKKPDKVEKSQGRLVWRYSLANWSQACELVQAFDWDAILSDNIDLAKMAPPIYEHNEANNTQQAAALEKEPPIVK
jgi:DNA modification methylase